MDALDYLLKPVSYSAFAKSMGRALTRLRRRRRRYLFISSKNGTQRIASARIYATAMGIYELTVNGKKAGDRYFAPDITSYATNLQYQTYDVGDLLTGDDVI